MSTVYLTEQGSSLRKEGERFIVMKSGRELLSVPAVRVERVMVFGAVQVTTQAMGLLLENGVDVSFLSMRGLLKGRLAPVESKNVVLRLAQYERGKDEAFRLSLGKEIVRGKIRNQRDRLQRHARNYPDADLEKAAVELGRLMETVDKRVAIPELMGVEGSASATYFRVFGKMLRSGFQFERRTRRPPRDPVSALLSFGYTLVGNELLGVVSSLGMDPHIGFLHGISYGRPSLSLDLLEEFRAPVVDRLTLSLLNLKAIKPDDFEDDTDHGCHLRPEAMKRYLQAYDKALNTPFKPPGGVERTTFRRLFARQAHALARAVKEGGGYEPYWHK